MLETNETSPGTLSSWDQGQRWDVLVARNLMFELRTWLVPLVGPACQESDAPIGWQNVNVTTQVVSFAPTYFSNIFETEETKTFLNGLHQHDTEAVVLGTWKTIQHDTSAWSNVGSVLKKKSTTLVTASVCCLVQSCFCKHTLARRHG